MSSRLASRTCSSISRRVCSSRRSRSAAACCGDALLFGGDFFGAALAQRIDLAGQRLQLAIDVVELGGRRRLDVRGFDQVLADVRAPVRQVGAERCLQEIVEDADEDGEVDDRPEQPTSARLCVVVLASASACSPQLACTLARRASVAARPVLRHRDRQRGRQRERGHNAAAEFVL